MSKKHYPESLTMEDGTVVNYRPMVSIKCIYCNRTATMAEMEDGNAAVIHEMPYCAEYMAMDPLTYIRRNRKKLEQEVADNKNKPN